MLHEILLSLMGHPSPILNDSSALSDTSGLISPPEKELLSSLLRLGEQHMAIRATATQLVTSHPATACRSVASAIISVHLAAFRQAVLKVEQRVLRQESELVGAYNIVPLTAVATEFSDWARQLDWLRSLLQSINQQQSAVGEEHNFRCTSAGLIELLRGELQTGYADLESIAFELLEVAETAWLKQASAWVLFGRLPSSAEQEDFFVRHADETDHVICWRLLPPFVNEGTARSMLFLGKTLNYIRTKGLTATKTIDARQASTHLAGFAKLTLPVSATDLSGVVSGFRHELSRTTLQRVLPEERVLAVLQLLRDFMLLGRGEFATALVRQAQKTASSRWRREDIAHEKHGHLSTTVVKDGEVAAVLSQTWTSLRTDSDKHVDEDEGLEMARTNLRLIRAKDAEPPRTNAPDGFRIATAPFNGLLLATPVNLVFRISPPLDLIFSSADAEAYSVINAHLLAIRRAHIRLSDLWTNSSLRRHHPSPASSIYGSDKHERERTQLLRQRFDGRARGLRTVWATCSAALYLLSELESYLQTEVAMVLWQSLTDWFRGFHKAQEEDEQSINNPSDSEDIWLVGETGRPPESNSAKVGRQSGPDKAPARIPPDPDALAEAHRNFLTKLVHDLLLTEKKYTAALYELLIQLEQFIGLINRLQSIWISMDLETDVGVVDALLDLEKEESDLRSELSRAETVVRKGVHGVVLSLRNIEEARSQQPDLDIPRHGAAAVSDLRGFPVDDGDDPYRPASVGNLDRLLMKLDFGTLFGE